MATVTPSADVRRGAEGTALDYLEAGFSVIPLSNDKRPHLVALRTAHGKASWKQFQSDRATRDDVAAWYEVAPSAGLGIVTGSVSGGLVVADYDRGNRPASLLPTPVVQTGSNGLHVYMRGEARKTRTTFGDLLGDGAYVVAPPSIHGSGLPYRWLIAPEGLGNIWTPESTLLPLSMAVEGGLLGEGRPKTRDLGLPGSLLVPQGASSTEEFAHRALGVIGLAFTSIGRVSCPFHADRRPSAGLFRGSGDGGWVFSCRRCCLSLSLGQLYAKSRGAALTGPTISRWWTRLMAEAGALELPPLSLIPPEAARPTVRRFVEGFALRLQVDAVYGGIPPTSVGGQPFAESFAVPWLGIGRKAFMRIRGELLQSGWLTKTGTLSTGPRPTGLWLPTQLLEYSKPGETA